MTRAGWIRVWAGRARVRNRERPACTCRRVWIPAYWVLPFVEGGLSIRRFACGAGGLKSVFEVSGALLAANLEVIRRVAGPTCEVLGVIKADAYGHGATICARVLAAAGLRWLGVGDVAEGRRVREALRQTLPGGDTDDSLHLVVMCGFDAAEAPEILAARLTPVVWTLEHLDVLEGEMARRAPVAGLAGERLRVHLEIDSGMARQGVAPGPELDGVLLRLRSSPSLMCEGVFSHLQSSEIANSVETKLQCERFAMALAQVKAAGVQPAFVHLGNSSAIEEGTTLAWIRAAAEEVGAQPMVRPGLALYGYTLPLEGEAAEGSLGKLHPVGSWTARVIGLRSIAAGETVGYGATFRAKRPMWLALLPVGYADGFRREASSGIGDGWVMTGGLRASVVGRVSMNLTVVDVTDHVERGIPVTVGTEAVLLGEGVSAVDHARWAGTIPYEILCGLRGYRRLHPASAGPGR